MSMGREGTFVFVDMDQVVVNGVLVSSDATNFTETLSLNALRW